MIKVLIVDDSTVFRSQIRAALSTSAEIEIVGFASNGRLAIEALRQKVVDVVTLDLEMPEMDGLQTLAEMRRLGLTQKVIVFSAQSQRGAALALEALSAGARDFVAKPILERPGQDPGEIIRRDLLPKVLQFNSGPQILTTAAQAVPAGSVNWATFRPRAVVIASSTGGPAALEALFATLRPPFRLPVLLAQHMPPVFTATLAERLSKLCGVTVAEGQHGEVVAAGRVYIAPGNHHMRVVEIAGQPTIQLDQGEQRNFVRPAADHLFESAVKYYKTCLGVVLTGMGADGLDGAKAVRANSGAVMIQNRETCTVFGMPGAVFAANAYDLMGDLTTIGNKLVDLDVCSALAKGA